MPETNGLLKQHYILYSAVLSVFLCPTHMSAMTYRSNQVNMPLSAAGYTNVSASYAITSYSITSGQDPDAHIRVGLTNTYTGNNGSMTYSIGRQGSSTVANWFSARIASSQNTFNSEPGELNFAFLGTLKLTLTGGVLGGNTDTYTLNNVAVAQGSAGGSNNWWFGGTSCAYSTGNTVNCSGTSTAGYTVSFGFLRGGNDVSTINLVSITYPPYVLFSVAPRFSRENVACTWQALDPDAICPPYVLYYNSTQSTSLQLTVRSGLLYNSQGTLFDTTKADRSHTGPAAIFVMSSAGVIYASNVNVHYLFHHSTILGGASVASAGELVAVSGVIQIMSNCSGHYLPTPVAYSQLVEALHRQGYTRSLMFRSCSPSDLKY